MDFSAFEAEWHPTKNLPLVFSSSLSMAGKYWWVGACGHEWEATLNKRTGKGSGCLVCSSFALVHSDLASEWHPTMNGDLTPVHISAKATGKYWWLGECGHEFEASLYKRTIGKGSGCPYCSSLAVVRPEISSEWHPTKNGEITPAQISAKASDKYWWLGECGHEWEDYLHERTKGRDCLVCSGKKLLVGLNDLNAANPSVASEWHPTKNGDLAPEQFLPTSTAKVWWLCSENHEWEATIQSRAVKALGCPYCSNRNFLSGFNDFATVNPAVSTEWHPTKNGDLTPDQFITVSATKVWWLGECGHEWETSLTRRSKGSGCPYCANHQVLAGFNDLSTINPELASEWHPTKNDELTPVDIVAGFSSKVWWVGGCGHEWEATVGSRNRGISNCPICRHPEGYDKELLSEINDLATVKPEIAAEWHPVKNGELTPDSVVRMFDEKVWWIAECGYEWEATPKSRKTAGCPECKHFRIQPGVNDLAGVDPVIAAEWHPTKNSTLMLQHISVGSEKKVWWICAEGHEWEALVKNRVSKKSSCHECSGRKKPKERIFAGRNLALGVNDLATVSPEVASEWHPTKNGDLTPQRVSDVSHKKVWWLGECGHEWEYEVRHRVQKRKGCPFCKRR